MHIPMASVLQSSLCRFCITFTYFGLVQEERSLQLEVELLSNWFHEVASRPPVQDQEAELRFTVPLVHEERSFRLRLLPLVGSKPGNGNVWNQSDSDLRRGHFRPTCKERLATQM